MEKNNSEDVIFRILDANINRLREALRAVEEYFRFVSVNPRMTVLFKTMRHSVREIEGFLGAQNLVGARNTHKDPLALNTRPEELDRSSAEDVLAANFKRAQEASRVIEEYSKVVNAEQASKKGKELRFGLYEAEKMTMEMGTDGQR